MRQTECQLFSFILLGKYYVRQAVSIGLGWVSWFLVFSQYKYEYEYEHEYKITSFLTCLKRTCYCFFFRFNKCGEKTYKKEKQIETNHIGEEGKRKIKTIWPKMPINLY